jgi:hypothetical protein
MGFPRTGMKSFADNLAVANDDTTHQGIRGRLSQRSASKFQTTLHHLAIEILGVLIRTHEAKF